MQWVFWICLCMVRIAKFSISQIYWCMQLVSLYTNMQVAVLAMEDMLAWMEEGGQVLSFFTLLIRTNECYHPCEVISALTKHLAQLRDGCIIHSGHQVVQCLLGWSYENLKDKLLLAKRQMVKKLSFAGRCLWCYQQHKCTPQYASEVGRRKMQGMCSSLSLNYMYLEPMQAKPDTSFSSLWYMCICVSVLQLWNAIMGVLLESVHLHTSFETNPSLLDSDCGRSSIIILQIMTNPPFPAFSRVQFFAGDLPGDHLQWSISDWY